MVGSPELSQLADLLRIGATTARQIAGLRPNDRVSIERLAARAEEIANEIDAMLSAEAKPVSVGRQVASRFQ